MGKQKKSTKKFEKNHLRHTIEQRKKVQKFKKQVQQRQEKKVRGANGAEEKKSKGRKTVEDDEERIDDPQEDKYNDAENGTQETDEKFQDMSVDDFFSGGFELGVGGEDNDDDKEESSDDNDDFAALEQIEDDAYSDSDSEVTPKAEAKAIANGKVANRAGKKGAKILPKDKDEGDEMGDDMSDDDKTPKKLSLKTSASQHKVDLDALRQRDPEFYKFLQENDQELLEFDLSDVEDESDDEVATDEEAADEEAADEEAADEEATDEGEGSESESDDLGDDNASDDDEMAEAEALALAELEGEAKKQRKERVQDGDGPVAVTKEMVTEWGAALEEKKSLRALRKLLIAFRAAARMNETDEDAAGPGGGAYKVESAAVFNKLVITALRSVPSVLHHHLPPRRSGLSPATAPKWKALGPVTRSYLNNVLRLLRGLTENDMILLVVKEAEQCGALWGCFPKIARDYLKLLLDLWSSPSSIDTVRIQSFLNVRTLATTVVPSSKSSSSKPINLLDACLKATYMTFVRHARATNAHTLPRIRLMRNLAVELVGVDLAQGYQAGFVYVRQMAIHLRNSMNVKSKESYKAVYNWQFIHCLDFWSAVLAVHCDASQHAFGDSPLYPLIYPLVQVALGVIRLIPTAQYFPLRFVVIRSLTQLVRRTSVFIPLASSLVEILESTEVRKKARPSTIKPLDWECNLRAPKQYLHGRVYQEGIMEELYDCMLEYYVCFATNIAFPELVIPAIVQLKRHIKRSNHVKSNKQLQQLIEKLEQNARFVEQHRSRCEFAPTDQAAAQAFLRDTTWEQTPLGTFVRSHRKIREQRRKMIEEANAVEEDE